MWSLHTDCSVWENLSFRNTFKTLQLHLPDQEDVVEVSCGLFILETVSIMLYNTNKQFHNF